MVLSTIYKKIRQTFHIYSLLSSGSDEEKIAEERLEVLLCVYRCYSTKRYIAKRRHRARPSNKFAIDLANAIQIPPDLPWLNEIEFLNAYRLTKSAFWRIVDAIKDHEVFKQKRGPPQQPVAHQLMTLLYYIGTEGSGASNHRTRNHFHIGYGSAQNFRRRIILAIRESLRPLYYNWPNEEERKTISAEIQREFLLPNCIGAIDGTTFRLLKKPERVDASDFKGRKDGYTLSGLFLFDHKRRVRYYNAGWAGSAHDNRIFLNSSLYRNADGFFSQNEYVVGDSAFQEESFCVPTYRNPTGGTLFGTKAGFNTVVGRIRVVSEHGFGNLKGRFPILSEIPIVLDHDPKTMWDILDLVDTCVILHNFIVTHNENSEDNFFYSPRLEPRVRDPVGPLPDDDELNLALPPTSPRGLRREKLRAYLSENSLI